jgi:putative FmdB family regulatory protein
MPIYEYRCDNGHLFEVMQRITDDPVTHCETCEAPVSRVFHPIAVHFKGKGFYNTDYGTAKRKREQEKAGKAEGGSSEGGGGGGDSGGDKASSGGTKSEGSGGSSSGSSGGGGSEASS